MIFKYLICNIFSEAQKIVSQDSHKIIGLQSGSNKGASQAGMTPYGAARQIIPDGTNPNARKISDADSLKDGLIRNDIHDTGSLIDQYSNGDIDELEHDVEDKLAI